MLSAAVAVGLLISGAPAAAQTTVAGITPGSLAVDETGAANYSLPIQVPPGVAGLSPDLSLLYRSRKKNGALGVGWVLDGVSVIERCARTIAQDGARGGIDYSVEDRFCLDKDRLVSVGSGTYGENGTEYRTEIESFSKIISYNLAGTGPEHFKVWTKSGQILEYGATADSRVEVPGQADVRYWALNKVTDRYGNEMTFSYAEDTTATSATENTHKLTRIDYGGNTLQGTSAQASVRFTYEARTDTRVSYVAQARSQLLERMKSIETYAKVASADTLVKSYNLAYDYGSATGRSRLASVTECDGDLSSPNCLIPVEFTYEDTTVATSIWAEEVSYLPPFVIDDRSDDVKRGQLIDVDGDGRVDFLRAYRNASGTSVQKVWLNTGSGWAENVGYKPPFVIEDKKDDLRQGELVDVDGDGLPDFLRAYRQSNGTSVQKVWLNTGSGWAENVGYKPTFVIDDKKDGVRRGELIDVDGDGRVDFLRAYRNAGGTSVQKVVLNTGSGWVENAGYKPPFVIEDKKDDLRRGELVDVNGDGLPDFVRAYRQTNGTSVQKTWLNTGSGWSESVGYKPPFVIVDKADNLKQGEFADVNGDGLSDFVRAYRQSNGTLVQKTWLNTGSGWAEDIGYKPLFAIDDKSDNLRQGEFADVNGDGLPDFVRAYRLSNGTEVKKTWLNTGVGWTESVDHLMPDVIDDRADDVRRGAFSDVNGDGLLDWVRAYRLANGTSVQKAWLNTSGVSDTLISVTDSLGRVAGVTYKPLTDSSVYTKDNDATFPERDIQVSAHVVSQISRDDGIGGQKLTNYTYAGGRYHDQGRKFLGFRQMLATDLQTNNVTTTTYMRDYRYSGFVEENKIATASGALLEKTTYTWASSETVVTDQPDIVFPYLFSSTTERYEVNDGVGNLPLITETLANTFDAFGNPTLITGTTTGNGETFTTTTTNTFTNDTANWLLGLRTRTEVNKSRTPGTAATRTMTWAYDLTTGYVTQEVIEPDTAAHTLTRDYSYDLFGNHTDTTVSGGDIATRSSSASYDGNGLLMVSASNALVHSETRVMDARFGITSSLTGPNQLTSTWLTDGFGRRTKEIRADGTETRIGYELCPCTDAPAGAVYRITTQNFLTAGGTATNGKSIAYFDKLNRNLRTETEGFDGTAIYVDSKYNARGFIEEVSRPYYAGTDPANIKWVHTDYDDIGRRLNLIEPDSRYFVTVYDGFKTVNTNPGGQVEDRITNAVGELVSSRDHLDAISSYSYDPFGNLTSTDVEGHVTSMTYDIRGNKITMDDPDMGLWTYSYDVLGQLLTQTDAKSQLVTKGYDKLGRQTSRIELEGTTTWIYDNAAMGVGKIHQITGPNGYLQVQSYDSLGRPDHTTRTISGTTYQTSMTYDAASRESTRTYPSGFVVQNNYNARGYLDSVSEVLGGTVYWQANAVSAEGKVTQETLGNGVVTTRSYDPAQNLVQSIQSSSGATTIQDLSFVFDQMGNLTERKDLHRDRTEAFAYDNRNQLTSAALSETSTASALNTTSYSYSLIGNIENKSDVGNYLYGQNGAGPHAVTSVTDDIGNVLSSYSYDANGGMTAGAGRSITWTSFRKPQLITDSLTNNSTAFVYGPNRARIQQTAVTLNVATTTTYIGNTYERRSRLNEPDELVHFIRASDTVAIFTEIDDGSALTDKTRYLHRDHIYSVESITDELGVVTEHLSYDAHGKRRLSDWQAGVPATPAETPRGFTGHEHLDGVGLIHMNGRVYAPELGRMLSADPYVQIPETPKGFNRYAYVFNNPLSFTDPSGFFVGGHSDPFGGGDDNRSGEENRGGGPGSEGNDGLGGGGAYGGPGGNTGGNSPGANSGDPGDQSDFGKNYTGRSYGNGVVDGQGKDTRRGRFGMAELLGLDKEPRVGSPYASNFVVTVPTGIVIGVVTLEKVGWAGLIAILGTAATVKTVETIAKMEEDEKPTDIAPEQPVDTPLGDLTQEEIDKIQSVVDKTGRPLDVVGSAAAGERRGVGTDAPIGKGPGTKSDIDYSTGASSLSQFDDFKGELPDMDPESGIMPGGRNPHIDPGPSIRFEPGTPPSFVPGVK